VILDYRGLYFTGRRRTAQHTCNRVRFRVKVRSRVSVRARVSFRVRLVIGQLCNWPKAQHIWSNVQCVWANAQRIRSNAQIDEMHLKATCN